MNTAPATASPDPARQLLRHTLATVAYRGGKALRGAPDRFATFHIGDKTRTPAQILAHLGDLFDWALSIAQGKQAWKDSAPLPWNAPLAPDAGAVKVTGMLAFRLPFSLIVAFSCVAKAALIVALCGVPAVAAFA